MGDKKSSKDQAGKVKVEKLKVDKETIKDLTAQEQKGVKGGVKGGAGLERPDSAIIHV